MEEIPRRIHLNPCDYLIYGKHRALLRKGQGGNIAYMMVDAVGHAPPPIVRDAVAGAMRSHPVTTAGLAFSALSGRPYWQVPLALQEGVESAIERAYVHEDLQQADDVKRRLTELCHANYAADWDLANGPQIRFEHYTLPNNLTRFCLRWPHCLMDAEGAQWFLAEVGAHSRPDRRLLTADDRPIDLPPDHHVVNVLVGRSIVERYRLFRRGLAYQKAHKGLNIRPIIGEEEAGGRPEPPFSDYRAAHQHFSPEQLSQIKANAKKLAPPGRALYARFLGGCVIRAIHLLYTELEIKTDAYLLTLPVRVTMEDERGHPVLRRPIIGNYLVSPTLCVLRQRADDMHAIGEDIFQQLGDYHHNHVDIMQWAMLWTASLMRVSVHQLLYRLPLGFENLSSGFSYYGEIAHPVVSIAGAKVVNVYGGGPQPTPPGMNPVFSSFKGRLNLSLTWNSPAIPDKLALRFLKLINEAVFAAA